MKAGQTDSYKAEVVAGAGAGTETSSFGSATLNTLASYTGHPSFGQKSNEDQSCGVELFLSACSFCTVTFCF